MLLAFGPSVVVDPVVPVLAGCGDAVVIRMLNPWALVLLSLMAAAFGAVVLRRR